MSSYFIKPKISVEVMTPEALLAFGLGKEVLVLVSNTVASKFNLDLLFNKISGDRNLYLYKHIHPDAPFKDLDTIINDQKERKLDLIVAIGGGSVIDAAKALSVSFEGINYKDMFYGRAPMPTSKIKVLAVPTTAGTGAELSFGAILYDDESGIKGGIRGEIVQPDYVLIDARLHNSGPFKLKAEVGFDCLTHAVETYISRKSNPLVKIQSVSCIQNIFAHLVPACKTNSLTDMEKIAISSTLMGINLAYSSTCLPHRIQYVIGPMTGTSHAMGLIALYKGWLRYLLEEDSKELNELATDLGMNKWEFCKRIDELKQELLIAYSLADLGIKEEQIEEIAGNVTGALDADPSYKNSKTIVEILKYAF